MINSVKLYVLNEFHQMRKLHRDYAIRLKQNFHSCNKVVNIRYMRQNIVAE
ncbi:hypothetical protein D3C87_1877840 [compost metagenome]